MPKKPQAQSLGDLRRSRAFTQHKLARGMRTSQSEVSKLEQRRDTYVSTLRAYVRALGGELELVARFRDAEFRIGQFGPQRRR